MNQENEIVRCNQIEPGMIFDNPDDKSIWVVKEDGDYMIENGVRVPIDNCRKNKWWVQKLDSNEPPILACFSTLLEARSDFNFRHPTATQ